MDMKALLDRGIAVAILAIAVGDMYRGALLLLTDSRPILWMARPGFWVLSLLPAPMRDERRNAAMQVYVKRRKLYGAFAVVGGIWAIALALAIWVSA